MFNRREFLTTAALAALAPAGAAEKSANPSARMLFGVCAWSLDLVPKIKAAGFDFWEGAVSVALDPTKDEAWWKAQRDAIRAMPLPIRSCNGFLPGSFRLTGPKADPAPALDYAEKALRRAEEVGVKTIVFGSGGARNVPGDFCGPRENWPDLQKGARQYADFCRRLCARVKDLKSVQVVIEPLCPNESNIINFVWQGVQICQEVNSPRLAQLADLFHMTAGREEAASIVKAGALLKHCHVAEVGSRQYPGHDPKQTPLLKPYFEALKSIGYTGGVSCECGWGKDIDKEYQTALKTLKELAS